MAGLPRPLMQKMYYCTSNSPQAATNFVGQTIAVCGLPAGEAGCLRLRLPQCGQAMLPAAAFQAARPQMLAVVSTAPPKRSVSAT